jgi:hypothetical protein
MTPETISEIKKEMGYNDGTDSCRFCQHYTERSSECDINVFYLPVASKGWCRHGTFIPPVTE